MSTTIPLAFAVGDELPCEPCVQSAGLCRFHAEHDHQLMPLLREPSWHRHVHRGENDPDVKPQGEKDAAAKKAERKRERREARKRQRLGRAMDGEFTRTRVAA